MSYRTLTAAIAGSLLLTAAQLSAAPPANACASGQLQDEVTGMCWSQNGQGQAFGGPGDGPCLPGRLGNCVGSLQRGSASYTEMEPQDWPQSNKK